MKGRVQKQRDKKIVEINTTWFRRKGRQKTGVPVKQHAERQCLAAGRLPAGIAARPFTSCVRKSRVLVASSVVSA